ncbi:hypothetical protein SprV_0401602100 [Sparganum proliferum]
MASAEQQSTSFSSVDLSPRTIDLGKKPRRRSDGSETLHKSQKLIDRMSTCSEASPDLSSQSKYLHFFARPAHFDESLSERSSLSITESTGKLSAGDEQMASLMTVRPAFSVDQDFLAEQWELSPLNHQRGLALRRHSHQGYKISQMFKAHETTKSITHLVHLSIASASHDQDDSSDSESSESDRSISELGDNLLQLSPLDESRHDKQRTLHPAAHLKLNLPEVKAPPSIYSSEQRPLMREIDAPMGEQIQWMNLKGHHRAIQDRKAAVNEISRIEALERCKLPPIARDVCKSGQAMSVSSWWSPEGLDGSGRSSGGVEVSGGGIGVESSRIESTVSTVADSTSTTDSQVLHQLITDFRDAVADLPFTNFLRTSIVGLRAEEPQIWMHVFRSLHSNLGRELLTAMIADLKRTEPKIKTLQRLQKAVISCIRATK